jgi:phosphate transport system permease protein
VTTIGSETTPSPSPNPSSDAKDGNSWASARAGAGDRIFHGLALAAGLLILAALAGVFIFLLIKGAPGLTKASEVYEPLAGSFIGYVIPLLAGTVMAAVIALIIAVPLAFGIALVISHYAPRWISTPVAYVIDLLAAVPSVIYGLWGVFYLAPRTVGVSNWLHDNLGFIPLFGPVNSSGTTYMTAGIVLAVMILPIITAITREVFSRTPRLHQEAALALGATRWEMVRMTVIPYGRSGMVSAVMLGLGRALGETMAVTMVLSVGLDLDLNILGSSSAPSIAANIALKYKERSADLLNVLVATGLVLFLVTFLINFAARWVIGRSERKMAR